MAMPDWIAISLAVASPILSVIATAYFIGRRVAVIETTQNAHTKTLEALPEILRGFVTQSEGKGYQAQLDRLERSDAECEGKMSGIHQESTDRIERLSSRVTAHEQATNATTTAAAQAMARMETLVINIKESVDRLREDERTRATQPEKTDIIAILTLAAQAAPLVKQLLGAEPQRPHA